MKFFKKLLFVFFVSFGALNASSYLSPEKIYLGVHTYYKYSKTIGNFIPPVASAIILAMQVKAIPSLSDVPENIKKVCHEKFIKQGLNPDTIQIKLKIGISLEALFNYALFLDYHVAREFSDALLDLDFNLVPYRIDQQNNPDRIVKLNSTMIDHEIAHLKNNDSRARLLAVGGVFMVNAALSWFIKNLSLCRFLFEKPTNIKEFFTMIAAYSTLSASTDFFSKFLLNYLEFYQEKRADAYAITQATDPQALYAAATFFEEYNEHYIDFLCGVSPDPDSSSAVINKMKSLRESLILQHQREGQTEEFSTWVRKQAKSLNRLHFMFDQGHPTPLSRAQLFYQAADLLEAKINNSL